MIPKKEWARDTLRMLLLLGAAVAVCSVLSRVHDDNNPFAVLIFVLAVAIVALVTNGYVWGVLASVIGVFCVNYMFTYPFWSFDMSITGYPLTFVVMLVVSVVISTLTTRVKQTERLRYEIESEKLRADLLRALSHDLRTPLASIEGADSLLLEQPDLSEAERRTLLEQIRQETRWLTRITENMLSVTRMAGEQVSLHRTDEVVEEIVDSAVMKLRRSRNTLPVTVIRPQEILTAPMDATLMEQVLLNLLENAALHGGRVKNITLAARRRNDKAELRVEDDGCGLMEEDPIENNRRFLSGAKLGLRICRLICRRAGWKLTLTARPGGGTRAQVAFPLASGEAIPPELVLHSGEGEAIRAARFANRAAQEILLLRRY